MAFLDQGSDWNVSQDCSKQARRQILSNCCLTGYVRFLHSTSTKSLDCTHTRASKQVKVIPTTKTKFNSSISLSSWLWHWPAGCVQVSWYSLYWGVCWDSYAAGVHLGQSVAAMLISAKRWDSFMFHLCKVGEGCWLSPLRWQEGAGRTLSRQEDTPTEHRCDQVKCLCFSFPKGSTCPASIVAIGWITTPVQTCLSHKSILLLAY